MKANLGGLAVRVIPTLLWKGVGLVKGVGFDSWRRVGPVLPAIKVYNGRDVDELILLDITASLEGREPDYSSIEDFVTFSPFTIGGGVKTLDHIANLLRAGADKVSINTSAYLNPDFITQAADKFGSQCIVVSIDVKDRVCHSYSGQLTQNQHPVDWAMEMANRGAGEILLTSIDRDGTMSGYDLPLIKEVAESVNVSVIASGGCGNYQDMIDAIDVGASAVAAASIFHFTEQTPIGARAAMREAGLPVR